MNTYDGDVKSPAAFIYRGDSTRPHRSIGRRFRNRIPPGGSVPVSWTGFLFHERMFLSVRAKDCAKGTSGADGATQESLCRVYDQFAPSSVEQASNGTATGNRSNEYAEQQVSLLARGSQWWAA